jgi:hypothetical protein
MGVRGKPFQANWSLISISFSKREARHVGCFCCGLIGVLRPASGPREAGAGNKTQWEGEGGFRWSLSVRGRRGSGLLRAVCFVRFSLVDLHRLSG